MIHSRYIRKNLFNLGLVAFLQSNTIFAASSSVLSTDNNAVNLMAEAVQGDVVKWRRHIHQHPELSNREFNTAKYIVSILETFDLKIQENVAHTGVVAILDTEKPGPVVALRADIDALPIKETTNLSFASRVTTFEGGKELPVMHACGHDAHTAMLLGAAKLLSENRDKLVGKVKFVFQPAEEGQPEGEEGGAELMVAQGVMDDVDVVFGLHVNAHTDIGVVKYKEGGILAASDSFKITINGKPAHGAFPWLSIDPVVTGAQVIMGLQTIVSRELRLIDEAATLSIGTIQGGVRTNIIPASVIMTGTIRTLDPAARKHVYEALPRKVNDIASSMNATAEIELPYTANYPITYNPKELMERMLPSLERSAGKDNVQLTKAKTASEDFSYYQQKVPGLYLLIGSKDPDVPLNQVYDHHTPGFYVDERGMSLGVSLFLNLTSDYMGVEL
ncbi:MAG: amidohydrolase [Paraglaciecola sp.]|uniref:M20 metallopeptidase family protein n=1 Tax=Paraglaciecola sp. TaxID=1920173 RepID=UPI003296B8F6